MRQSIRNSRYATLDGLRGAAAMVVVILHFHALFHLPLLPHAHLAVDLFFAMSGFVLANAYDRKLSTGGLLFMPWKTPNQPVVDLLIALFVLPAIVWAASRAEPSAHLLPLFAFSGAISYAVYVLHAPFGFILQDVAYRTDFLHHPYAASAVILLPGIVLLTWCADRYYDTPVRRALHARLRGWLTARPKRAAAADATMQE